MNWVKEKLCSIQVDSKNLWICSHLLLATWKAKSHLSELLAATPTPAPSC